MANIAPTNNNTKFRETYEISLVHHECLLTRNVSVSNAETIRGGNETGNNMNVCT